MDINISDEVLAEIGKIVVVFSYIEASLAEIIGKIITLGSRLRDELGIIMTAELAFRQRIATLDSLLMFALGKDSQAVIDFGTIKPLLCRAEEERNKVVHSVWTKQANNDCIHAVIRMKSVAKQKSGLRIDSIPMRLEDLREIAELVGKAYAQLCCFELQFHQTDHDSTYHDG